MAGLKNFVIGFLLAGAFIMAIISGWLVFESNNNSAQNIGDDPTFITYKSSLEDSLNTAQENNNGSLEALGDSPISVIPGAFIIDAIAGIWKTLKVVPVTIYNLTIGLLKAKVLGSGYDVFLGILSAIAIAVLIFAVVKFVSTGQDK